MPSIKLELRGLKHVPSFKNHKMLARGRMITDPRKQAWMKAAEDSIVSQLYSMCQTEGGEIQPECMKQLQTFLSGLSDDSIREIPKGDWDTAHVNKGEEGATIWIHQL